MRAFVRATLSPTIEPAELANTLQDMGVQLERQLQGHIITDLECRTGRQESGNMQIILFVTTEAKK